VAFEARWAFEGVTSLGYRHQRVQRLRLLVARRSARREQGCFVAEGTNLLEEALAAGARIESVYVDGAWAQAGPAGADREGAASHGAPAPAAGGSDRLKLLLERCAERATPVFELEPGVLARVAGTVTPQPVLAVVETPTSELADLAAGSPQLVVVCVDVRDPGNAGTVARSAWAAGADAVVCSEGTVDLWGPKAVRSSAGAVFHVPIVAGGRASEILADLGEWGMRRLGTVPQGGADYAAEDLTGRVALVLGNEAAGLPLEELRPHLDRLVSIPMAGRAGSLNVGMAAAVVCFEAARQRRYGASGPRAPREAVLRQGAPE
jgi:RNA methyltransferase, TrmH family